MSLARIHIAKTELRLTDDQYRDILRDVFGVASSKELGPSGQRALLAHFQKLGWQPKLRHNVDGTPASGLRQRSRPNDTKVRALWLQLHALGIVRAPSESALSAFVKRQTGADLLHWLRDDFAVERLIESLKKWAMRYLPKLCDERHQALVALLQDRPDAIPPELRDTLAQAASQYRRFTQSYDCHLHFLMLVQTALVSLQDPLTPA